MEQQSKKQKKSESHDDGQFDLDALLHPSRAFMHPIDVVHDSDLTRNEKRAILASWASDACAMESAPELRSVASGTIVRWDDIMDSLRALDQEDSYGKPLPHYKRFVRRQSADVFGIRSRLRDSRDRGQPLN